MAKDWDKMFFNLHKANSNKSTGKDNEQNR